MNVRHTLYHIQSCAAMQFSNFPNRGLPSLTNYKDVQNYHIYRSAVAISKWQTRFIFQLKLTLAASCQIFQRTYSNALMFLVFFPGMMSPRQVVPHLKNNKKRNFYRSIRNFITKTPNVQIHFLFLRMRLMELCEFH